MVVKPKLRFRRSRRGRGRSVVGADIEGGQAALGGALAVRLALAAGVTLGEYLDRPVSGERDRFDERVRRRAMITD